MNDTKKIAEKHVFGNSGFGKYVETGAAETLRASGGDIGGGGAENIVIFAVLQSDLTTSTSPRHSEKQ